MNSNNHVFQSWKKNFLQLHANFRNILGGEIFVDEMLLTCSNFCLSVCLFWCPIITLGLFGRFATNFDWRSRENHGNILRFKVEWVDFNREK